MTRRRWIAGAVGTLVVGSGVDAFAVEPRRVDVTRHRLGNPGGETIRIVQLTDLHLRSVARHEERIAAAVDAFHPDLILLTGDSIDRANNLPLLESFLSLLPAATPKLAILGNWEHWGHVDLPRLAQVYAQQSCQLLRNESVTMSFGRASLLVTGLDDLVGGAPNARAALAKANPQRNHLLLAHCPEHRDLYRASATGGDVDPQLLSPHLMLAGHTHGGQIAPFGWAPLRPRGSGRYVSGWYRDAATSLYVSRGLGTSIVPARFFAAPEVACFEWVLAT